MKSNLIFDIELSGHHSEYIKHLVEFLRDKKPAENFIFIVHPEFVIRFYFIVDKIVHNKNIKFHAVSWAEYNECKKGNRIIQSLKTFRLLKHYAKEYKITRVFLLYFNTFQFALGLFQCRFEITGILFSPFYRLEKENLKAKLEYFRKVFQTKLFIRNKRINKIFILNDTLTAAALNTKFKINKFQMLPDPVPELNPLIGFSVKSVYNISQDRKVFLHFGSLSGRKGTLDILDSFIYLSENDINKLALILAGKASSYIDSVIKSKISYILSTKSGALIIYKNEFVSDPLMKSYFDQCDFVLVPYKNIESSSGIIGHAIASGKPVIGTRKGLIGDLIKKNKLGILIDESSPQLISESIHQALDVEPMIINNSDYMKSHTPEIFASTLIYAE